MGRGAVVLVLLLAHLASACPDEYQAACAACSGTLSPTTCACSCGWTRVEKVIYSLVLLPLALVTLAYL